MQIPRNDWLRYIDKLSKINQKAAELMTSWIDANGYGNVENMVAYANGLTQKYGEAAAALACEMYDAVAAAAGVTVPAAEAAEVFDQYYIDRAVRGKLKEAPMEVPSLVGRLVKQAGADTTLKNARRDDAQFAWIPSGDTCAYCITLASRGWQKIGKKTLKNGHAEHIHANCNCEYAIRFSSDGSVAGYDPQKYKDMYYGADGKTPKEKINAMRRENYAENKDKINEQKREWYEQKNRKLSEENHLRFSGKVGKIQLKNFIQFDSGEEANQFFYYDDYDNAHGLMAKRNGQYGKWRSSLSSNQQDALYSYTADGYGDVNSFLRKVDGWEHINADMVGDQVKQLDSAISSFYLKEGIIVQRGATQSSIDVLFMNNDVEKLTDLIGKKYSDDGFMSTTVLSGNPVATTKPVVFDIIVPAGKGRGAYINEFGSQFQDVEYEFLLKRGSTFTITDISEDIDMDKIYVKMVMDIE